MPGVLTLRRPTLLMIVSVPFLLAVPSVAADDRTYVGFADCNETTGGCLVPDCEKIKCEGLPVCGVGLVCFESGHFGNDIVEVVSVTDSVFSPMGAFVCQDLNDDLICGGDGEPRATFCGSVALYLPAWSHTDWTFVAIGGPRVNLEACNHVAAGTTGMVTHH